MRPKAARLHALRCARQTEHQHEASLPSLFIVSHEQAKEGDGCDTGPLDENRIGKWGYFACSGRQFRITFSEEVSWVLSVIIRNRLPSGAMSQLMGPLRMPVSSISVSNNA